MAGLVGPIAAGIASAVAARVSGRKRKRSSAPAQRSSKRSARAAGLLDSNPRPAKRARRSGRPRTLHKKSSTNPRVGMGAGSVQLQSVGAMATMGAIGRGNAIAITGPAMKHADYTNGIRLRGNSRYAGFASLQGKIKTGTNYSDPTIVGGASTTTSYCYGNLNPKVLSLKADLFSKCFEYYAIRRIRATYVPIVPTSTAGSVNFSCCYEPDDAATYATTLLSTQCLEYSGCATTPVYQAISWDLLVHNGSRCWNSDSTETDTNDIVQATILCTVDGGAASTVYGYLDLEWEIDFYEIRTPSANEEKKAPKEDKSPPPDKLLSRYQLSCVTGSNNSGDPSFGVPMLQRRIPDSELKDAQRSFSVENDDVKSLYEEKVGSTTSKRIDSIERSAARPMSATSVSKKIS